MFRDTRKERKQKRKAAESFKESKSIENIMKFIQKEFDYDFELESPKVILPTRGCFGSRQTTIESNITCDTPNISGVLTASLGAEKMIQNPTATIKEKKESVKILHTIKVDGGTIEMDSLTIEKGDSKSPIE